VQVSVVAELARNYFELRGAQWRLAVAQRSLTNQRKRCGSRNCAAMPAWVKNKMLRIAAARVAAIESTIPSLDFDVSRTEYIGGAHRKPPGELQCGSRTGVPIQRLKRLCPSTTRASCCSAGPMCVPLNEGWLRPPSTKGLQSLACFLRSAFPDSWIVAGRGSQFFTGDSRHVCIAWVVVVCVRFRPGAARACVVRALLRKRRWRSMKKTVLRALEETENALASYHAQQARLIK